MNRPPEPRNSEDSSHGSAANRVIIRRKVPIFSESWDELGKLKGLGLTEHSILVYLVNVHKGKAEQSALDVVLRGRTLNSDQVELVRALLTRLYIRTTRGRAADASA